MNTKPIPGLHHVTAIAGDPQRNLDFYTEVLGLRFVKKTVNFDDPGTYHFYFGDDAGTPGTILTFFPWPHATRGTRGAGEVSHTAFSIPPASLTSWEQRLAAKGSQIESRATRFGESVLTLSDPDGMQIELVAHSEPAAIEAATRNPRFSDVPAAHAIRGFFGVTLLERELVPTVSALALLGFHKVAEEDGRTRFSANGNALGNHIDVVLDPTARRGRPGAGTVHHIAFRSADFDDQKHWLAVIQKHLAVSPIMERDYFRSIYFREPGGVLFELATDIPGFTLDEPLESLGEALRVPAWLGDNLAHLTRNLPAVTLHKPVAAPAKEEVLA
jgi:glyoxalase family protein